MLAFLSAGSHAIVSDVAYGGTYRLCTKILTASASNLHFADGSNVDDGAAAVRDNTKLILTETPANPTMKCSDIAAISEIAKKAGAVHAVDNTFLTPYYQLPFELGADISIHSTTKYMDGHNATVGGAVISKSDEHAAGHPLYPEQHRHHHVSAGRLADPAGLQDLVGTHGRAVRKRDGHRRIPRSAPESRAGHVSRA